MTHEKVLKLLAACLLCVAVVAGAVYLAEWLFS